jgi:two-component system KDP operon response regulator KdpE
LKNLGNLELDLLNHVVKVEGQRIPLSAKEFKILTVLMEQEGAVLNRYQILRSRMGSWKGSRVKRCRGNDA